MITADIHTHTTFSADGISDIKEMIEYAIQRKLEIYGISEHFNYDYDRLHLEIDGEQVPPIQEKKYFTCIRALQKEYASKIRLLAGAEFGFDHDSRTQERYLNTQRKYKPDFIINSVHTCLGADCYFPHYCKGRSKAFAYNAYLYGFWKAWTPSMIMTLSPTSATARAMRLIRTRNSAIPIFRMSWMRSSGASSKKTKS